MWQGDLEAEPVPSQSLPHDGQLCDHPSFVGAILNWSLLGSLAVQIYVYIQHSMQDPWMIKGTVFLVLIMDLTQTGVSTDYAWKTLVSHWGDPSILSVPPPSSVSVTIMASIISMVVQIFFAWRIWMLNRQSKIFMVFPVAIFLVAIMQCSSALVAAVRFTFVKELSQLSELTPGFTVWLVGSFVADILIAGCMLYTLHRARKRSFSGRSESVLTRLVRNTIETGAVTAVAAGVELVLFLVIPETNYHVTPAFLLGKLYSNVLMANLNARGHSKATGMDVSMGSASSHNRYETSVKLARMGPGVSDGTDPSRSVHRSPMPVPVHISAEVTKSIHYSDDESNAEMQRNHKSTLDF
ncbi:hypothetical protein EYR36_010265 [Pleurotus pulmonarius]|nr:hypothetical protein EYR36_010265 [Pleurotus pulmonarius]